MSDFKSLPVDFLFHFRSVSCLTSGLYVCVLVKSASGDKIRPGEIFPRWHWLIVICKIKNRVWIYGLVTW